MLCGTLIPLEGAVAQEEIRPRAREVGVEVGIFQPGSFNAITDVTGVLVGQTTVIEGEAVHTGITAVFPHGGSLFHAPVPAAIYVGNGFGKLIGITQVRELGEIETPILLTCTLCVWRAADAMVDWLLGQEGMEDVRSINPIVGETNDGSLNDIRSRSITPAHVRAALESARTGRVEEGAVGAGAGTIAFGWKGGIGTSSRVLPEALGGFTVGVLVQSNFGGILSIGGAPVGVELEQYAFRRDVEAFGGEERPSEEVLAASRDLPLGPGTEDQGSIMMVVATDAPLSDRNLERVARRAIMGLARTGSFASNGSGDYVIAFSTASQVRRTRGAPLLTSEELVNRETNAVFQATVEATEEAIYNSLFKATTVTSNGRTVEALPLEETLRVLREYGVIPGG